MAVLGKDVHLNFDEDVIFYEVEKYEDTNLDNIPEDELENIEKNNMKFLTEVVETEIMKTFSICPCQMPDFIMRNERKRQIMAVPPQAFQPTIEQEDIDRYRYAVIVVSEHGVMTGVSCYMRECKTCHKIEYWGDVEVFAHLLAEITTNFVTLKQEEEQVEVISDVDVDADNPLGAGAILTDIPENNTEGLEVSDIPEDEGDPDSGCCGCCDGGACPVASAEDPKEAIPEE